MKVSDLGQLFGVTRKTIHGWMNRHPDFKNAVMRGRDEFDNNLAETCLRRRVTGYDYEEVTEKTLPDGNVETTVHKKHLPPDTHAIMKWLHNRHQERWKDERQITVDANLTITLIDRFKPEEAIDVTPAKPLIE
jgi:hypothetical protein